MIENIVGSAIGIKLINGKFRPKFGVGAVFALIFFVLLFIISLVMFILGLLSLNINLIFVFGFGAFSVGYILAITPYTQNPNNFYIEFQNENSLAGFRLSYKGKQVAVKYSVDNNGKIAFADNNHKLNCISYADGTNMSNLTKCKIINYFTKWLNEKNLLSTNVTTVFE